MLILGAKVSVSNANTQGGGQNKFCLGKALNFLKVFFTVLTF